ncbi:serine hydrolase [Myroides phaeus]|uniref:serine hydrolase n=1 Tax=Myroides phaeus TaxID=702745 RepID=UPI001302F5A7|nr:serine hydrolase [Myroides phaeus]
MKNIGVSLLVLLFASVASFGQAQEKRPLIDVFVKDYNANDYDDIYSFFSASLQQELPRAQAKSFFVEMKEKLGNIKNMEFYGLDNNQLALYRTEFENNEVALLNLAMNEEGEVVGFRILNMPDEKVDDAFKAMSVEQILVEETRNLPNKGQFAVAMIDDKNVTYYGFKKNGEKIAKEDNATKQFSLANLSTIFTSAALANASVNKGVDITSMINQYYDFPLYKDTQVSLVKLANHSAFVPMLPPVSDEAMQNEDDYLGNYSSKQLEDYLKNQFVLDSIDNSKRQSFSFLGYAVLGNTLSKIYNKPFTNIIDDVVFSKYGMHNSSMLIPKKKKHLVKGIRMDHKEMYPPKVEALLPSSGGVTTLEDMTKFVQAQFNKEDKVLQLTQKPTLIVSHNYWIGLGWKIGSPFNSPNPLYFSRGIDGGYSNYVAFDPIAKKGVVILSNSSSEDALATLDELSYKLVVKLLEE